MHLHHGEPRIKRQAQSIVIGASSAMHGETQHHKDSKGEEGWLNENLSNSLRPMETDPAPSSRCNTCQDRKAKREISMAYKTPSIKYG